MLNELSTTRLYGLGTSLPAYSNSQTHAQAFMSQMIEAAAGDDERDRALLYLEQIVASCGVERRFSPIRDFMFEEPEKFTFFPPNWALAPAVSTARRMMMYERTSVDLAAESARRALQQAGALARDVTHVIFVTCTGFFAPGPDILLVERLGLRPTVQRAVIGFMGCYAAFNGLRMADQIVRAEPDAVVLQVHVELCSLHFQNEISIQNLVSNCLFGDGSAAAVYARPGRFAGGLADIEATHCALGNDSLAKMSWRISDHGFSMYLDTEVPRRVQAEAAGFVRALCDRAALHLRDVERWAVHPGGPKILDAVCDAIRLHDEHVAVARQILRYFGNMSSTTILFVLEEMFRQPHRGAPMVMLGFGPGLTMEGAVLREVA